MVDKSVYESFVAKRQAKAEPDPIPASPQVAPVSVGSIPVPQPPVDLERAFQSITISGKVDVANYSQIFSSFINPLIINQVEIEIRITGKSTQANSLAETSKQYRITKESAKQLGLRFEVVD